MTNEEQNFVSKASELINDVRNYILSNNDWIYYFLNPLCNTDANKALMDIIEEYNDYWDEHVNLQIINFNGSSVGVTIEIDNDTDSPTSLKRFIYIPHFSETVEKNKKLNEGKINELKIANLKESIKTYKKILSHEEAELEQLLKNNN